MEEIQIQKEPIANSDVEKFNCQPITNLEFTKFKDEIFALINQKETTLNSKIEKYHQKITEVETEYNKKTSNIVEQYNEFTTSAAKINNRLDRLNTYEAFTHKTNDQIVSHEIRITNISKDLAKAISKYDKIYLDNLVLPGFIGECCKFKNAKEFFDDTITQIGLLNSFKEKNILDLKKYKERLENIIKTFNLQVDNNTKANMKYTNEICEKTEKNFKEKVEELNEKILEMRMENSKYCIELKAKSMDLSKEWDKMIHIKEDIYKYFDEKVEEMLKGNETTANSFQEVKGEFSRIRRKFGELAEFIKDVRFRKNIGGDVKKREIKQLVNKISFKRKNSYDDNAKNNKILKGSIDTVNRNSNNSTRPMRQSQSQEVEGRVNKYIRGESSVNALNNNTQRKKISKSPQIPEKVISKIEIDSNEDDLETHMRMSSRNNITSEVTSMTNTTTCNNNNNNVNNNRYDVLLDTNDQIIHELAAELEQSANKLDRIGLSKKKNDNISNVVTEENVRQNTISEEDTLKKNSGNNSYLNVFDVRKGQKELDKKLNQCQKKVTDLEVFTRQKLLELSKQIDSMSPNSNTTIIHNLFGKDINPEPAYHQASSNTTNKNNQVPIVEIGGGTLFNLPPPNQSNYNNINMNNANGYTSSVRSHSKPGKLSRVRTGNQSSRLNKMIMQTLGNTMQEEYNQRGFNPEYKVIKKIDRRQIIDCDGTKMLMGNNTTNNIGTTHWVPVQSVLTNKGNIIDEVRMFPPTK